LSFNQKDAVDAILYLDKINDTNNLEIHKKAWRNYIKEKSWFSNDIDNSRFEKDVEFIHHIRDYTTP
jgi:hypothetical protein